MKTLKGIVVAGLGDFSKRMEEIPGLLDAYERKTGMRFYPGTLNIKLEEEFSVPQDSLLLDKKDYGGRVSVHIVPCHIFDRKAFILRTEANEKGEGSHPRDIIEIACNVRLRDTYNLTDGSEVEINIETNS